MGFVLESLSDSGAIDVWVITMAGAIGCYGSDLKHYGHLDLGSRSLREMELVTARSFPASPRIRDSMNACNQGKSRG